MNLSRTVVLIGMMGAGKTKVGRLLAQRLGLRFIDADTEIQEAAGCSIEDIFETQGEAVFREGERKVIARAAERTGACAGDRRRRLPERLYPRRHRGARRISMAESGFRCALGARIAAQQPPDAQDRGPRRTLAGLIEQRYPVYALADLTVVSGAGPVEETVAQVEDVLRGAGHLDGDRAGSQP